MLFGIRKPRVSAAQRRGAYRPKAEALEERIVLAGFSIDLANVATNPFGVQLNGFNPGQHVGSRVAYVGNVDNNQIAYDDFLVAGPDSLGIPSQVYLVFGSHDASTGNVDWRTLTSGQRVGSLQFLGNPNSGQQFNYDGVSFTINDQNPSNATVAAAGDIDGDGIPDFLIGFPNADNGAGRAYLVYGSTALQTVTAQVGGPVNLDAPPISLRVVSFVFSSPGAFTGFHAGTALGGISNFFGDGVTSVVIGAPDANIAGTLTGAVYVVRSSSLTGNTQTVFINGVGQTGTGNASGLVFTGINLGDRAGRSVASLTATTNFDGSRSTVGLFGDLVIGAPDAQENNTVFPPTINITGPGDAYVIYGATNFGTFVTNINGVSAISLGQIGQTGGPPGVDFVGQSDATGFAVSSGGDFNNDGFSDVLIGSPFFQNLTGQVTMVYGRGASSTAGAITGTVQLSTVTTTLPSVQFTGTGAGAEAGRSVTQVGRINNDAFNEIMIGSPGFLNNSGAVYLIPGQAGLTGSFGLSTATADPVAATIITNSTPLSTGGVMPSRLGESVSGRLTPTGALQTLDNDAIGDFAIGGPGFSPPSTTTNPIQTAGAVFGVEGFFVPLAIPVSAQITTQIGVDQPFAPFVISATTPTSMQIFVFSNAALTPPFRPVTDINPTTVAVNGIQFPNATLVQDPIDENGDGIPDAIITISPRSSLGLPNGVQTLTITGQTLASSPNANKTWAGSASIRVTGAGPGPGPSPVPSPAPNVFFALNFPLSTDAIPPLGSRLVPTINSLNRLTWQPIPIAVAYQQFKPQPGFSQRLQAVFTPINDNKQRSRHDDRGTRTFTLGNDVFNRSRFHPGKTQVVHHTGSIIPTFLQRTAYNLKPKHN
jgi:FG-GAP repeat